MTLSFLSQQKRYHIASDVAEDVQKDLAEAIAEGVNSIEKVDSQITVDADYKAPNRGNVRGYADV